MMKSDNGPSFLDRVIERIQLSSKKFRELAILFKPCRFSIFAVMAGVIALLLVPQGQDLLRGLAERTADKEGNYLRFFFILSALFWTFSAWYWSSVMLRLKLPGVPENQPEFHKIRVKIPRYLGFAALLCLAAALFRASFGYENSNDQARIFLRYYSLWGFLGALFFLFIISKRRSWMNEAYKELQKKSLMQYRIALPLVGLLNITPSEEIKYGISSVGNLPRSMKAVIVTTLILDFLLFLCFWLAPQQTAPLLGSAAILLFATTGWIAGGSLLDFVGMKLRIPLISVLFILSIVFSAWNDNHVVRTLPSDPVSLDKRLTIDQALMGWLDHQLQRPSPSGYYPLFIVAAEGGGIRAAYWTAGVLSRITDDIPSFPDQLFALSGVSGGSLGSAVFLAQLADAPTAADGFHCAMEGSRLSAATPFLPTTKNILGEDFLSPTVGAMLYPDFFQRVLPWPVRSFDRARAMEQSWERSWSRHTGNDRFFKPFDDLWRNSNKKWLPALFLNSTRVETGKRLIVSNLRLEPEDFNDVEDINRIYIQESLPLSAAVHLSARFTYISPAGTLKKNCRIYGRAVDGGYFENSGETTVLEILQALDNLVKNDKERKEWKMVKAFVIHISNEPVNPTAKGKDEAVRPGLFLNEALSPVMTMLNTRNARAAYARETVMWHVEKENFLHFGLSKKAMGFPLGWVLSPEVQKRMDGQLCDENKPFNNPDNLKRIRGILDKRYKGQ